MADDSKQRQTPQISRRPVIIGLIGLAAVEAISGGITWKVLSQGLDKIYRAFSPTVPTIPPGTILYTYRGHSSGVNTVKWSPNGKRNASGSDDQTVQVWDTTTGIHPFTYSGHHAAVNSVAWSPDGGRITSGGGAQTLSAPVPPAPTPTPVPPTLTVDTPTPVPPALLSASPDSLTFNATQGLNNPPAQTLTLTNTDSASITWSVVGGDVSWLSVNPQRGSLSPFGSQKITIAASSMGLSVGTYSDTIVLATSSNIGTTGISITLTVLPAPLPSVLVWNAVTGSTILTYTGHKDLVNALVWPLDGTRIISGSSDATVQVWNAMRGDHSFIYRGHSGAVLGVALSPDGKHIASASADKTVRVWEVANGESVSVYRGHSAAVKAVEWSLDGKRIASGGTDQSVQIWDAFDGSSAFTYLGHSDGINSVAWSHDSKYIASASSDRTVQVWSASTRKLIVTYKHVNSVYTVAWSPDGTHIASAGRDATVQVWKAI